VGADPLHIPSTPTDSIRGDAPPSPPPPPPAADDLRTRIALCMTADQRRFRQRLQGLVRARTNGRENPQALVKLASDIERSALRRTRRAAVRPRPTFPPELPISERREEIARALSTSQVVVVCGETGSGKSTQLPKICLELGRGVAGLIGHTQPRRIAARSVAQRLADELGSELGGAVGFKVRFSDQTAPHTHVKVMTDGVLLAEIQSDPLLEHYDTIIIDEAHERSLNIDFLLGYLKTLLPRRPDLKLIITSATIDPQRFSAHFDNAPIVMVSGRTYPVEVRYRPVDAQTEDELEDQVEHAIVSAVAELAHDTEGDILVFLASEREIRETAELLEEAGWGNHAEIVPLFARLSGAEQMKVFQRSSKRRIVLATNVAETSITVPGVRSVIDSGFARMSRYSPKTKVHRLPIEAISKASAQQRAGRCGRVGPGVCIRLYSEQDLGQRAEFTTPEILRTNLSAVLLRMLALRLGDPATFPFVEPPEDRMISDAFDTLRQLQAVDDKGELTSLGTLMARLPVDPPIARIILAARDGEMKAASVHRRANQPSAASSPPRSGDGGRISAQARGTPPPTAARSPNPPRETRAMVGALEEVLIIVAALSVMDPRERPLEHQQKADLLHARFRDEQSDFVSYLRLWWYFKDQSAKLSAAKLRKLCRGEFLSFVRLREWDEVHRQLLDMISELPGGSLGHSGAGRDGPLASHHGRGQQNHHHQRSRDRRDQLLPRHTNRRELHTAQGVEEKTPITPLYEAIHRALLTGLLSGIGKNGELFEYDGARGAKFQIFPGSSLFKRNPQWVVAAELVRTTKLYARAVARVQPEWIEQAGEHLLKRSYSEEHYDERTARVMAYEKITLLGLTIVPKRRVPFERIDPKLSREIFIHSALVEGLLPTRGEFMAHNQRLLHEAKSLQHKLRRADILADTSRRFAFFDDRLPEHVLSGSAFEKWRHHAELKEPRLLFMQRSDVIALSDDTDLDRLYPDELHLSRTGEAMKLRYLHDESDDADGVSVVVPIDRLAEIDHRATGWLVPGFRSELFETLIRSLPKRLRVAFSPVAPVAADLARTLTQTDRPMIEALAHELSTMARVDILPGDFNFAELRRHLSMNFIVVDRAGRAMLQGRDLFALRRTVNARATRALNERVTSPWIIDNLTNWSFDDPPEMIEVELPPIDASVRENAFRVSAYPALANQADGLCALRLFASLPEAVYSHRLAQVRLFRLAIKDELRKYLSSIKGFNQLALLYSPFGTQEQLREQIALRACELTFVRDGALVRTAGEFKRRLKPAEPWIDDQIKVTAELFSEILTERQRVALALSALSASWAEPIKDDALDQLAALITPDFLVSAPMPWFKNYPKYLRALERRLSRAKAQGAAGVEKDQRLARDVHRRLDDLDALRANFSPDDPRRESAAMYRWLLEEYRVTIFAQDLAGPMPVSPTKLDELWNRLQSP
jgi:ATP-dependent helicase HrpA